MRCGVVPPHAGGTEVRSPGQATGYETFVSLRFVSTEQKADAVERIRNETRAMEDCIVTMAHLTTGLTEATATSASSRQDVVIDISYQVRLSRGPGRAVAQVRRERAARQVYRAYRNET